MSFARVSLVCSIIRREMRPYRVAVKAEKTVRHEQGISELVKLRVLVSAFTAKLSQQWDTSSYDLHLSNDDNQAGKLPLNNGRASQSLRPS